MEEDLCSACVELELPLLQRLRDTQDDLRAALTLADILNRELQQEDPPEDLEPLLEQVQHGIRRERRHQAWITRLEERVPQLERALMAAGVPLPPWPPWPEWAPEDLKERTP